MGRCRRAALTDLVLVAWLAGCGGPEPARAPVPPPPAPPLVAPQTWPVEVGDGETTTADQDADGVPDVRFSAMTGGSGWKTFTTCVRHGASGHAVCAESAVTAYALFGGRRRVLDPIVDNRAVALIPESPCPASDPASPTQGGMEALKLAAPLSGEFAPRLRWHPGRPADQASVCLSLAEAATYPGGLTWQEGTVGGEGWTAWYAAAWPQWTSEGGHDRTPKRVSTAGVWEVYQLGHALAVYDPGLDRHAWIANFGVSGAGFKVDRWERIAAVEGGDGVVEVTVADSEEGGVVRIKVGVR